MATETLIFMPNGDVTLTLTRHILEEEDPENAIDEHEAAQNIPGIEPVAPPEPEELEDDVLFYAPDAPDSETFYPPPRRGGRGSDASSRRDRSTSPPASFWASLKRQQAETGDSAVVDDEPAAETKPVRKERVVLSSHDVHCIVSSRHMMLASQYFEKLLSGTSEEAVTLRTKRHVSIPLSADLDAMIILLNIVHGVSRKVPRQVKLETLRKLATLVSAFGMIDAVQFFSDTWIDDFQRKGLPTTYSEKVLSLLFVFWVFDRPAEFKNMTRITQRECDENLDEDAVEVPIPRAIIDAIKRDREFAMESAIAVIHTLINKYLDGQTICDGSWEEEFAYACDATVLGSLMKSSRKIGIWPKPEAPFPGRKFKDLAQAIRSIRVLDVCKKSSSRRLHLLGPSTNSHGLEDSIEAAMKGIEAGMEGLILNEYPKKGDDFNFQPQMSIPTDPVVDDSREEDQEMVAPEYPIYTREKVEAPRREFSISPPPVSTHTSTTHAEEPRQIDIKPASRQHSKDSTKREPQLAPKASFLEEKKSVRENGNNAPRNSWIEEVEKPTFIHEEPVSRNSWAQKSREHVFQNGSATSSQFRYQEPKELVYDQEMSTARSSREQEAMDYMKQQTNANPRNIWTQELKESVYDQETSTSKSSREQEAMDYIKQQTNANPRNSWSQEPKEPLQTQSRTSSRDSWNLEVKEPVVEQRQGEQRKASPRDSWSQGSRTPPTVVSRSPIETPKEEAIPAVDRRQKSGTSFPRDEAKALAQESFTVPRNSSTERVKVLGDRALHRTPSLAKISRDGGASPVPQQPVIRAPSTVEEARISSDRRSNSSTPSYVREETKTSAPAPPKMRSSEEAKGSTDRKPNTSNPFTSSSRSDIKSPLSQAPVISRVNSTEEPINGINGTGRLNGTKEVSNGNSKPPTPHNPFTKPPTASAPTPLQPSPPPPRVPSREEVAALTNKKLNTISLLQIPSQDTTKAASPLPTPRLPSTENVTKITVKDSSQVPRPDKEDGKPVVEIRASDAFATTEDEDAVVAPQKFNMRKSKKKFQAKY